MSRVRSSLAVVLCLSLATAAMAFTVAELQARADTLLDDLEVLEVQVDNCPDGDCPERQQIEDDFDVADSDRLQLNTDRATLEPCSTCSTLDATLSSIDDLADTLRGTIQGWNEQG